MPRETISYLTCEHVKKHIETIDLAVNKI